MKPMYSKIIVGDPETTEFDGQVDEALSAITEVENSNVISVTQSTAYDANAGGLVTTVIIIYEVTT